MEIRSSAETDATATLRVFLGAVTETASVHYSAEQIAAWARPVERDVNQWNSARKSLNAYVATMGAEVAGFSDVGDDGYIDMMFVAPKFGRRGVAGALLAHLHDMAVEASASELYTNASSTARPFFEKHGFVLRLWLLRCGWASVCSVYEGGIVKTCGSAARLFFLPAVLLTTLTFAAVLAVVNPRPGRRTPGVQRR